MGIRLTEGLENYARQSHAYSHWHWEELAKDHGWTHMGMIMHVAGFPVPVVTHEYRFGDVTEWAINYANTERIVSILCAAAEECPEDHECWDYGTADTFIYNADCEHVSKAVEEIERFLADYPSLDDERVSELEWEENHPSDTECYSSDPDCPCLVKSHECTDVLLNAVEAHGADTVIDEDGEWYCDYCQEWYPVTDEQWRAIRRIEASKDHEDKLAKGQLTLM